jgi:DNA-nicking Smr family endonuclease
MAGAGRSANREPAVTISDDDRKAFEAATSDVRRIKPGDRAALKTPKPKPRAAFSRAARAAVLEQSLSGPVSGDAIEDAAFCRDSVSLRSFRRLRRGEFAIEAEIDLHGLRLEPAVRELKQFVSECAQRGLACVRVIHGKGTRSGPAGPILKPSVQLWLSRWNVVLAFVSAQPKHGGSGAIYVLLKTR